jgi:3-hydroxyacyl-CoA dehydrogenase, C-terminal domain/Pyridine nucleotide-disulphide oxidoreductase
VLSVHSRRVRPTDRSTRAARRGATAVAKGLPGARLVVDHFHVIRLAKRRSRRGPPPCAADQPNGALARLGLPLDERGRALVDSSLRVEGRTNVWALGDCAAVPNQATPDRTDPPTCQHALRQARRLAKNLRGASRPYRYRLIGQGATLGRDKGIANLLGIVNFKGTAGSIVTRWYHLRQIPIFSRRLRVLADGTLSFLFGRDMAELGLLERSGPCPVPRRPRMNFDTITKFLALHFAIGVWDSNIGEVMGHPGTDPAVFDHVLTFAEEIGLVPIPIRKEQNGYIINSLLVPWCTAALDLQVRGVSDFESIDRTWMITLQTGLGPFGMMDRMGLGVVQHVATLLGAHDSARYLDDEFIRQGHLGVASGQGFYSYPNPAFAQPDFT